MQAREVGQFSTWLQTSPFVDDRLWQRPVEAISDTEIQLFYARAGLKGHVAQAREAIDLLQSEMLVEAMEGRLVGDQLRLIAHEVPRDRYTVDEFVDRLLKLSKPRRMAALLALTTRSEPEQVAKLEWKSAGAISQTRGLAAEVLAERARVRHIRLPYVFWEWASDQIAAPLLELRTTIEDAFEEPWPAVQMHWQEMIWIDTRADTASFMGIVSEVSSGKL
jgi:hypothetical protein